MDAAKETLKNAQITYEQAQEEVKQAENVLAQAQQNVVAFEEALAQKNTEIQNIESQLNDGNSALIQKQEELKQLEARYADEVNAYEQAQAKLQEAQNVVADAQAKVQSETSKKEELKTRIDAQTKTVSELKAEADKVQDSIAKGSLGFFEAMGYSDAIKIINEGIHKHGSTHLGDKNDATSLENMKATLQYIKECNELRKQHGLNELKVNAQLMAIAQVQLNHTVETSNNGLGFGHSKLYKVGENLSVNYEDPFSGWYHDEKKVADYLDAHGMTYDQIKDNDDLKQQIADELGLESLGDVQVGHYYNIINGGYVATGFAIGSDSDGFVYHGQVFANQYNPYKEGAVSVDAFFEAFDSYYSGLMGAQGRYEEAKAKLDSMKQEMQAQIDALNAANVELESAKENENHAQQEVVQTEAVKTATQKEMDALKQQIQDMQNGHGNEALLQQLQALKTEKEGILAQITEAKGHVTSVQNALTQAKQEANKKQQAVTQAETIVKEKEDAFAHLGEGSEEAKAKLDAAKKKEHDAQNKVTQATSDLEKATQAMNHSQTEVQSLETAKSEAQATFNNKTQALNSAKETLKKAQTKLDTMLDGAGVIDRLNKEIMEIEKNIDSLETTKNEAPAKIQSLNEKLAELEKAMASDEAKLAEIESVKANYEALIKNPNAQFQDVASKQEIVQTLNKKVRALQEAFVKEAEAKKELAPYEEDFNNKRSVYLAAKAKYESAKAATQKAMDALNDYLESQKQEADKEQAQNSAPSNTDGSVSQKEEGVNTGVATGTMVSALGMLGGLAGAFSFRRRKED